VSDVMEFEKAEAHIRYHLADGTLVPGVTTIVDVLNKPVLVPWANKMGLKGIDAMKYRDEAAAIGTLAHEMIACRLLGKEPDLSDWSPNQIEKATNALNKFVLYESEHRLEPMVIERPLVSEKYRFGGTPDYLGLRDGVPVVLDLKTGSGIYPDAFIQVAGYRQLVWEASYEAEAVYILRVGRDSSLSWEEQRVGNLDIYWEMFLHCLALYELPKRLGG